MADLDGDETRHCDGMLRDVAAEQGDQALRAHPGFLEGASGDGGVSARGQREWQTGHRVLRGIGAGLVRDPPPHEGVRGLDSVLYELRLMTRAISGSARCTTSGEARIPGRTPR